MVRSAFLTFYPPFTIVADSLYQPGDPAPKATPVTTSSSTSSDSTSMGVGLYALILIGGVAAYGAYQYLQTQQANKI